jgi:hypothetical protein
MNTTRRLVTTYLAGSGLLLAAGAVNAAPQKEKKAKKAKHRDGRALLGEKIKKNGRHDLEKKGPHTVSAEVKDGKIAGMRVKHDSKGEVAVTKYKTGKKMAQTGGLVRTSYQFAQAQSLGVAYIGYAYIDEYGYEEIYWYPYEMIWDGDIGAVEYVPIY